MNQPAPLGSTVIHLPTKEELADIPDSPDGSLRESYLALLQDRRDEMYLRAYTSHFDKGKVHNAT